MYHPRMPTAPVLTYSRISKRDDRSTSIEKQRANCRRLAAERYPGRPVVEHTDDGISASKGQRRAGLDAVMAALAAGPVHAVVVDTIDRVTRDRGSRVFWDLATACERAGAELVGASQEIDLSTAGGELTVSVLAAAATFESRRIADRVRATNALRTSKGLSAYGGPAPWGLTKDGDHYVPDPVRGPILADMVDRVIDGRATARGLARELTAAGHPSPYGAPTWGGSTVLKLLRSPRLAGMVPRGG